MSLQFVKAMMQKKSYTVSIWHKEISNFKLIGLKIGQI